jgi:glutathione S-transferase
MARIGEASVAEVLPKPILWGVGTARTFRVHWILQELGIEYTCHQIKPRTEAMERPEFLLVNPDKKIPVLQHGDLIMVESLAIVLYLAESYADRQPDLFPSDLTKRAKVLEWVSYISTELDAASLYTIRKHQDLERIYGSAPSAVQSAKEYYDRMLNKARRAIGNGNSYLLGENNFTIADILLTSCLGFANRMGIPDPPEFELYLRKISDRPAFQIATKANHL